MEKLMSWSGFSVLCFYYLLRITIEVSSTDSESCSFTKNEKSCESIPECEEEARQYLKCSYEKQASDFSIKAVIAEWNYDTNLTSEEAEEAVSEAELAQAEFQFKEWNETIRTWDFESFQDEKLKRQLKFENVIGIAILSPEELKTYNDILADMSKIYGTAKICPFNFQNCDISTDGLDLDPDIEQIFSTSRIAPHLAYCWKAWRDVTGKKMRGMYSTYIDLSNKAARENGFNDTSDLWLFDFESDGFKQQMANTWDNVEPLYEKLYGYTRFKLRQLYPQEFKNEDDPMPAHILGNMWCQQWGDIYDVVMPFPDDEGFDVTAALVERFGTGGMESVLPMFELANKFFMDLGLEDMSVAFGDKAVLVRPTDREVVCHASAWDIFDGQDFRIKMCTKVNQDDFITIHHELGHIQYYMQYKNQPITFREGANQGFHEAIGDVIALSVATTKHMVKKGFMNATASSKELIINYLMKMALEKVAFLPFGYLIDLYRWELFNGNIARDKMTEGWLKIRNEIQGIIPPVNRTEEDFDAGAKYHVPGNTPYIRYFFSFILQFQLHKALCIKAGQYEPNNPELPLHNCDIDGNQDAGAVMKELLESGASENWQNVLEKATGSRELDPSAIKEYFLPLMNWLDEQQVKFGYSTKWRPDAWKERYSPN